MLQGRREESLRVGFNAGDRHGGERQERDVFSESLRHGEAYFETAEGGSPRWHGSRECQLTVGCVVWWISAVLNMGGGDGLPQFTAEQLLGEFIGTESGDVLDKHTPRVIITVGFIWVVTLSA